MGNMNVNKAPAPPASKPLSRAEANTAAAQARPLEGGGVTEVHAHKIDSSDAHSCDMPKAEGFGFANRQDVIGKLVPGGPVLKPQPLFQQDAAATVEHVLAIGVMHAQAREQGYQIKTPDVEFHLAMALDGMTPGEMDEVRDAIVDAMASPDTTQRERDVLKRMYDFVDNSVDQATGLKPDISKIIELFKHQVDWTIGDPIPSAIEKLPAQEVDTINKKLRELK
ncbi:MAG: hypothetical protein ACAI44_37915 [Candidatus Sericytochromatia bacterium]